MEQQEERPGPASSTTPETANEEMAKSSLLLYPFEKEHYMDPEIAQAREIGQAAADEYGRQTEAIKRQRNIAMVTSMHPATRMKLVKQYDEELRKLTPIPKSLITREQEDPFYMEHCLDLNVDPNNEEMMHVYRQHWISEIRTRHLPGLDKKTDYKCFLRVDNPRLTIRQLLTQICEAEPTAFRINVEYAAILQNLETNELKYFFNAENTRVFNSDQLVRGKADMDKLILDVERYDFGLHGASLRPNTNLRVMDCCKDTTDDCTKIDMDVCNDDDAAVKPKRSGQLAHRFVHNFHVHETGEQTRCTTCGDEKVCLRCSHVGKRECEVCGMWISSNPTNIANHKRIHSGERPFKCAQCLESFSRKDHLQQHLRIHTREKPFLCEVCGMTFRQLIHLTQHQASIHSTDRMHPCEQCEKSYKRRQDLTKHMRRVHCREYTCRQCNEILPTRNAFTAHCQTHTELDKHKERRRESEEKLE